MARKLLEEEILTPAIRSLATRTRLQIVVISRLSAGERFPRKGKKIQDGPMPYTIIGHQSNLAGEMSNNALRTPKPSTDRVNTEDRLVPKTLGSSTEIRKASGEKLGKYNWATTVELNRTFNFGVVAVFFDLPHEPVHASVEEGQEERPPSVTSTRRHHVNKLEKLFHHAEGFSAAEVLVEEVCEEGIMFLLCYFYGDV